MIEVESLLLDTVDEPHSDLNLIVPAFGNGVAPKFSGSAIVVAIL
jgi:hypothetical protein